MHRFEKEKVNGLQTIKFVNIAIHIPRTEIL